MDEKMAEGILETLCYDEDLTEGQLAERLAGLSGNWDDE